MVYIYVKNSGNKNYYYLRASIKEGSKYITKDIAYLGNDINKIKDKISQLSTYKEEIKRSYRKLELFIYSNIYKNKAKEQKIKQSNYLTRENLLNIEACNIHFNNKFLHEDKITQQETYDNFIIELAHNTTSIEGNTISLEDARNLLLNNITPKNKELREVYDLNNTKDAFFWLLLKKPSISMDTIIKLHKILVNNIDKRIGIRTQEIRVFKSQFKSTPAIYIKQELEELINWYKENKNKLHPIVLSSIFHHNFERIHPFMDGNGRTGRLLMNLILAKHKYPLVIIRNKRRNEYLNSLSKADKLKFLEVDDTYFDLVNFASEELFENYWNLFL